jgi:TPR repeat protein
MARFLSAFLMAAVALGAASSPVRADLQAGIDAYFDGDYATALQNLQPDAEGGDTIAQYFLGEMYLHGKGVDQDFDQAAAWYARAAEHGHPQAQAALGSLEMLGLGGPRDTTNGYFWLIASVVWAKSDLRQDAMSALGQVAVQLSPDQKNAMARAALPEWKRSQ